MCLDSEFCFSYLGKNAQNSQKHQISVDKCETFASNLHRFSTTCGVRKKTLLDVQASPLFPTATFPVISAMSFYEAWCSSHVNTYS